MKQLTQPQIERLDVSERVISAYEKGDLPGLQMEHYRLVMNEIKLLEELRTRAPDRVGLLIQRYSAFAARLRTRLAELGLRS